MKTKFFVPIISLLLSACLNPKADYDHADSTIKDFHTWSECLTLTGYSVGNHIDSIFEGQDVENEAMSEINNLSEDILNKARELEAAKVSGFHEFNELIDLYISYLHWQSSSPAKTFKEIVSILKNEEQPKIERANQSMELMKTLNNEELIWKERISSKTKTFYEFLNKE